MTYKEILREAKSREKEYSYSKSTVIALKTQYLKEKTESGSLCDRCSTDKNLTLEHIIPLSMLRDFGYDERTFWDEEDLTILCRRCNVFKANRLDFADKRTKPLLMKYIQMIDL